VASPVPTTAGMPYSRATSEAWAARVPPSVTTRDSGGEQRCPGRCGGLGDQDLAGGELGEVGRPVDHADPAGGAPCAGRVPDEGAGRNGVGATGGGDGAGDRVVDQAGRRAEGERGAQAAVPFPVGAALRYRTARTRAGERARHLVAGQEEEVVAGGKGAGGDEVFAEEVGAATESGQPRVRSPACCSRITA